MVKHDLKYQLRMDNIIDNDKGCKNDIEKNSNKYRDREKYKNVNGEWDNIIIPV